VPETYAAAGTLIRGPERGQEGDVLIIHSKRKPRAIEVLSIEGAYERNYTYRIDLGVRT